MKNPKRTARITLLIVALLSAVLAYYIPLVKFDYDFEAFFSNEDEETAFFEEHRKRFETDSDFILVALVHQRSVFDSVFLKKVRHFVDELKEDSLVEQVQCITHLREYIKTPFSNAVLSRPYIHIDQPEKYAKDSARIMRHTEMADVLLNTDKTALLVNVKHQPYLSKGKSDQLKARVDQLLSEGQFHDFMYAGRVIGMDYYIQKMTFETVLFIGLSFALVILFLAIAFRSWWGLWLPLLIVGMSMVWIVGLMGLVREPISLILTVLPSIIFVVAMSDVIHLVSKFLEELRAGKDKITAVKIAYKEVGKATLLTSLTTAVGFLTLLLITMPPVQAFGLFTAIGVLLAFVLAYTLLPALLVLVKAPKVAQKPTITTLWYRLLHPSFRWVLRNRYRLLVGFILLLGVSIYGSSRITSNFFLLEDLKEGDPMRTTYTYFDSEFMGLRPLEVAIEVQQEGKKITDYDVLSTIDKVERFLIATYGLKQTFSIISILKIANRTEHGGQLQYAVFPTEEETASYLERIEKLDQTNQLALVVDTTKRHARIASAIGDVGTSEMTRMNRAFEEFLTREVDTDLVDFKITGTTHLLDKNMHLLSSSLSRGLALATGIVSLLMGLLFRSVRMVIIALIPNILPLLMLGGLMGFVGIGLKVSTAVAFTISFGIAVDDTIHFMSKLKLELNKGKPLMVALKRTFLSTGRAIVLTTIILIGGFLMLLFSDFLGTFYTGLLISCTLVFALIADLLFLPVLVIFFYRPPSKK